MSSTGGRTRLNPAGLRTDATRLNAMKTQLQAAITDIDSLLALGGSARTGAEGQKLEESLRQKLQTAVGV